MKIEAILATTEVDLEGDQFSEDCLKRAATETDLPQPMFIDFKKDRRAGDVVSLRYEDGKLIGTANIPKLAVVPGYMFDPKEIEELPDGTRLVKSCVILEWGLTCNPADPNCKIISIEEEE